MAEDRAIARGQQRGNEESILSGELRRLRRIHPLVDEVQPAGPQGAIDGGPAHARPEQLPTTDDPRLTASESANCLGSPSVFEGDPIALLAVNAKRWRRAPAPRGDG
jgi:hypothetical protein